MDVRLEDLFANQTLIRPSDKRPNLVHLVRALAFACGVCEVEVSSPTRQLIELIGESDHLVFVLLDGLGMNIIRRLPAESFIARHFKLELLATCPSTTACALTTVATADYPGRHGVTGWFTHLPEFGLTATILPFHERFTNQPLTERGIRPQDVLPLPAFQSSMNRDSLTLLPYLITHTTYATYARGGTAAHGYASYHHAVDLTIDHVSKASGPTYTHMYLPEVDTICHKAGAECQDVMSLVMKLDAEMARLHEGLAGRARLVLSADHGLIDVPADQQTLLMHDDPLLGLLKVPPSGDARMPIFHIKPEGRAAFVDVFQQRFGDRMVLVDVETAEQMHLFCPGPMAPHAKPRFGDFIAFPYRPASLAYHPPNRPLGHLYRALHAGLSPQEMGIPLCIA